MAKSIRERLQWYLMDDTSPLPILIWRYLKTRWRGIVWHIRIEWLRIDPFDNGDAMEFEDWDNFPAIDGDGVYDDYPGGDYAPAEWDFYDYGDED